MAIDLDTLFARIGRFGKLLFALHGGQADMPAAFASLYTTFGASYPDLDGGVAAQESAALRGLTGWWATPANAARELILRTVRADNAAAARSLPEALAEVRRQMIAGAETVAACAVTASAAALSGSVGTGVVVLATKRGDGLVQEHTVAEIARLVCTADSYSGGAAAGRESFTFVGEPQEAGVFDYDWPTGSAASAAALAVSADDDASPTGNLLTNGDFETWSQTPLQPDGWAITVGAWGTHVAQSATALRGAYSARFAAGATFASVYQQFNSSATTGATAGTPAVLTPQRSYAANLWLRTVTGTASAGVLTVELVDGSGTVVNDAQGAANSFTVDLTGLTTAWAARGGVFRLPVVPPAVLRLRLRISTSLAGADVLADDVCLAPTTQAYPGGPSFAVFSGATPFQVGDGFGVTTTNDRAGADHGATFQTLFLRLTSDPTYLLPSTAGAETLVDDLITDA